MSSRRRRTYSHLERSRKVPNDYEVATSELHYYVRKGGFEVEGPIADWYRTHQVESALATLDWEAFRDPRETTYTRYTELQRAKEAHLDGVFRAIDATGYDGTLTEDWIRTLDRVLPQLRFVYHAMQMLTAYIGSMSPSGTLTVAYALQAADEMRCVQRIAYRMAMLRRLHPGFGASSRRDWREDLAFQPMRKVLEELLVVRDWGESLVAVSVVAKPLFDEFLLLSLGRLGRENGDPLLEQILFSLVEDAVWHRTCTTRIIGLASEHAIPRAAIHAWTNRYLPRCEHAISTLEREVFDSDARSADACETIRIWLATLGYGG